MAEKDIRADEFYQFVSGKKDPSLCCVRGCRKERAKHRKLCHMHRNRLDRARNPLTYAYDNLRSHAKERGIKFSITKEEFSLICEATDYIEQKGRDPDSLSLDRIDPNRGYEFENIKVVTISENSSKGSYERWITTKDGRRVRLYQIGIVKEKDTYEGESYEGDSLFDDYVEGDASDSLQDKHTVTDNEPF